MQAIILSGGKGTRLYPLTLDTPKPMLPINGIPHLEYQIRLLKKYGITDIIFSTGYLHEQIEEYFEDGIKFGVKIQYKEDGDILLGTAGAVKNCESLITSDSFIVMNGDILTDISLEELIRVHKWGRSPITLTALEVPDASGFGLLTLNDSGKIVEFLEKPEESCAGVINAGMYLLEREVLYSIPEGEVCMFETDIFPRFAKSGMIQGMLCFEECNQWIDIGTPNRYNHAQVIARKIIF